MDPADGDAYTLTGFVAEYGGTAEWDAAGRTGEGGGMGGLVRSISTGARPACAANVPTAAAARNRCRGGLSTRALTVVDLAATEDLNGNAVALVEALAEAPAVPPVLLPVSPPAPLAAPPEVLWYHRSHRAGHRRNSMNLRPHSVLAV